MADSDDFAMDAMAERLRSLYDAAGVPLPDQTAMRGPTLYVGSEKNRPPPYKVASELGKLLQGKDLLFVRAGQLVTIDAVTGDVEEMTAEIFVTWIVQRAGITLVRAVQADPDTGKPKIVEGDLGITMARVVLASPDFRCRLGVVEQINRVRLPVLREQLDARGRRKIELLSEGYDAATKTFTTLGLSYDVDLDPDQAVTWLKHLLRDFPWGDEERSKAVFVQFFLTLFCRGLYIGKAPFGIFMSNLPGSGKSKLAQLCIEPVEGAVGAPSGWNVEDKQETRKEMDAAAQDFASYLWFDDVDRIKVRSTDLNRWLTSKTWTCRVLGTGRRFHGPLRAMTLMTGNDLSVDDNLERRTLWVDLFARMKSNERPKAEDRIELDEAFFEDAENMKKCLAVQWAMVRTWDQAGRPVTKQRHIEGFDSWCCVVASIAEVCGFQRGLAPYEAPNGGNQEGREWKALAQALIHEYCIVKGADSVEVTMRDVIRTARLNGLFHDLLGSLEQVQRELEEKVEMKKFKWRPVAVEAEDPFGGTTMVERDPNEEERRLQAAEWTDKSMDSAWAKKFRKSAVAGQYFPGSDGRIYEFGDRSAGRKSKFRLAVIG